MSTDNAKTKAHGAESASAARLDFPTWDEAISGITDSRFVGHQKIPRLNTNCTRDGARIMYDRLYVLMKSNVALTGAEGVRVEGTVMRKEEEC